MDTSRLEEALARKEEVIISPTGEPTVVSAPPVQPAPLPTETTEQSITRLEQQAANIQELAATGTVGGKQAYEKGEAIPTQALQSELERTQAKLQILESYKQAGQELPEEVKILVSEKVAPALSYEGGKFGIDVTKAIKFGVSKETLGKVGVSPEAISGAQQWLITDKSYRTAQRNLIPFITPSPKGDLGTYYNLEQARAFGGPTAYKSVLTLFGVKGWEQAGPGAAAILSRQKAEQTLKSLDLIDDQGRLNVTGAAAKGVSYDILRSAGYPVSEDEYFKMTEPTMPVARPTVSSFGEWLKDKGGTPEILSKMAPGEIEELRSIYQEEVSPGFTTKALNAPWYAWAGGIGGGLAAVPTIPLWLPTAVGIVGGSALTTLGTGAGLTIAGAIGGPTAQPGVFEKKFGWYGQGVEKYWNPAMEWVRKQAPGLPGQLITGGVGYFAPHELAAQLYPSKGGLALLTLIPHLGPTIGYTALTWERQKDETLLGTNVRRALGIGFGILPFAVGPIGSVLGGASRIVSKVPVLGTTSRIVGAVVSEPFKLASLAGKAVKLEEWAPWRLAYGLSGQAGRLGLANTAFGPTGARWGWWSSGVVPVGRYYTPEQLKSIQTYRPPSTAEIKIDLEEAMRAPRPLTAEELQIAKYGTRPQPEATGPGISTKVVGGSEYGYSPRGGIESIKPAAIVQTMAQPSWFNQFVHAAPRMAMVGGVVLPSLLGASFLPIVAPMVQIQTLQQETTQAIQTLVDEGVVSTQQQQTLQEKLQKAADTAENTNEYIQAVTKISQQTLTQDQQKLLQEAQQQQTQLRQQQPQQVNVQQLLQQQQLQQVQPRIENQWMQQIQTGELIGTPPTTPSPAIPPIFFPGGLGGGLGFAGGERASKKSLLKALWTQPGLVFHFPEPFTMQETILPLSPKKVKVIGGKEPVTKRIRQIRSVGMRI